MLIYRILFVMLVTFTLSSCISMNDEDPKEYLFASNYYLDNNEKKDNSIFLTVRENQFGHTINRLTLRYKQNYTNPILEVNGTTIANQQLVTDTDNSTTVYYNSEEFLNFLGTNNAILFNNIGGILSINTTNTSQSIYYTPKLLGAYFLGLIDDNKIQSGVSINWTIDEINNEPVFIGIEYSPYLQHNQEIRDNCPDFIRKGIYGNDDGVHIFSVQDLEMFPRGASLRFYLSRGNYSEFESEEDTFSILNFIEYNRDLYLR